MDAIINTAPVLPGTPAPSIFLSREILDSQLVAQLIPQGRLDFFSCHKRVLLELSPLDQQR